MCPLWPFSDMAASPDLVSTASREPAIGGPFHLSTVPNGLLQHHPVRSGCRNMKIGIISALVGVCPWFALYRDNITGSDLILMLVQW